MLEVFRNPKRTLESAQSQEEESSPKKSREAQEEPSSPSEALRPPFFAGRVSMEEDPFHWDEEEDLTAVEGEDVEYEDLNQGETPPVLSPEELDLLDQEAAVEELNRLSKIGVSEEFLEANANGQEKRMDLREVYDWDIVKITGSADVG
eukprot:s5040_g13.t1